MELCVFNLQLKEEESRGFTERKGNLISVIVRNVHVVLDRLRIEELKKLR